MSKIIIYLLLVWVSQVPGKAQGQMDWLMKQSEFTPVLKDHLHEVRGAGYSTVSAILFKQNADSLTVYLTAYTYLTEAKDHLPSSFTTINDQPFLIYDDSELLVENKDDWFKTVLFTMLLFEN